MSFVETAWEGHPVTVCRTGYTGERGYELVPAWEVSGQLWDALLKAAEPYEGLPCGLGARDTLRTEMGYALHGNELSPDITPVQARVGWAVGWKKESFWGKEALVAEKAAGPERVAWGLLATGRGIPRAHCAVLSDGERVGEVTSGTFSPTLKNGIALALLKPSVSEGDEVVIDVRGREVPARVVKPPFVEVDVRES
jgi:aminomethyltransferase